MRDKENGFGFFTCTDGNGYRGEWAEGRLVGMAGNYEQVEN